MRNFVFPFLLAAPFGFVVLCTGATWMAIPTMAAVYVAAAVAIRLLETHRI